MGIVKKITNRISRFNKVLNHRLMVSSKTEQDIITNFHRLYYDSALTQGTWENTYWLGIPIRKCPLDCWIYQEILFDVKPDVIIECGTSRGGSALFLANMCDIMNKGRVVTIDIEPSEGKPKHPRITHLVGSSTSDEIVNTVKKTIKPGESVLVIRDSNHHKYHVDEELKIYCDIVTVGSYLIVEDSNLNGNPVEPEFGPGPNEALREFLQGNKNYEIDKTREKFYLTFNPNGYLKRIK
jgi:cephalosporin hydroxylase